jgi:hypothetical protein
MRGSRSFKVDFAFILKVSLKKKRFINVGNYTTNDITSHFSRSESSDSFQNVNFTTNSIINHIVVFPVGTDASRLTWTFRQTDRKTEI